MTASLNAVSVDKILPAQEDAYALTVAALALDHSRNNPAGLAAALEQNVQAWIAVRTLVGEPGNTLPQNIRENLFRLSQFVFATVMRKGVMMDKSDLDNLININLQLSEGLVKGANRKKEMQAGYAPVEHRLVA